MGAYMMGLAGWHLQVDQRLAEEVGDGSGLGRKVLCFAFRG